jgi:cyclophilin family peptidyl-prolyl cis-trans isomerase
MIEFKTSKGSFKVQLFDKQAPVSVENFLKYVDEGFFDGTVSHRVIPGFMIQGGDVRGDGTGDPGYEIQDEKNDPHKFDKGGMLAMANRGPNTAGSQFFITEKEAPFLDDGARPGSHYQIFGQCQDAALVKKIAAVPKADGDRPKEDVKIVKVTIARKGGGAKKTAK